VNDSPTSEIEDYDADRKAEGARLIEEAFARARQSGKADWRSMRTPVLKNRILLLNKDFDERAWGVDTFRGFLDQYLSLVEIDSTCRPPVVRLGGDDPDEPLPSGEHVAAWSGPRMHIRSDLWRAVMDVESPEPYFWDGTAARQGGNESSECRRLPMATPEDLQAWREDFIKTQGLVSDGRLLRWQNEALSSRSLPQPLRAGWMAYLKRQVQERLEAWFAQHQLDTPPDMVGGRRSESDDPETDRLRKLVVSAIERMTRVELEELRLPARAMFRTRPR
jgi:hypothetical protein